MEFLEKELSISDSDPVAEDGGGKGSSFRDQSQRPGAQKAEQSSIEENIDEIEAALSRLKKELGL